jgi:hypothetical protein
MCPHRQNAGLSDLDRTGVRRLPTGTMPRTGLGSVDAATRPHPVAVSGPDGPSYEARIGLGESGIQWPARRSHHDAADAIVPLQRLEPTSRMNTPAIPKQRFGLGAVDMGDLEGKGRVAPYEPVVVRARDGWADPARPARPQLRTNDAASTRGAGS